METIEHHRITRFMGGSNHSINLKRTPVKPEQKMHNHHSVRLPHQKWLHDMDEWDSPVLIGYVKHEIHKLIADLGPDMYRAEAVRDWTKIRGAFEKRKGLWIPRSYEDPSISQ